MGLQLVLTCAALCIAVLKIFQTPFKIEEIHTNHAGYSDKFEHKVSTVSGDKQPVPPSLDHCSITTMFSTE